MKISRLIALAVIALLVVGAMGIVTARGMAVKAASHAQQAQSTAAPDTDNVDEQVGNQDNTDTGAGVQDESQAPGGQEGDKESSGSETDQPVPQGQAKITPEQANQAALAANPGGTILKTDLDDENGALVYTVEFTGGLEVKVDAMTGTVLKTESGQD